jgi:uncharacterized damage-inducible protein DinB
MEFKEMGIDRYRHLYEYHFTLNRRMWDYCIENLSMEQMLADIGISHGSIRNLFVHIMGVDNRWFSHFRKVEDPGHPNPEDFPNIDLIRKRWYAVEEQMREVLNGLNDEDLGEIYQGPMKVWHVLSHVVNHGTHHRAQLSDMLRHHGLKPLPQDYIFYVMGRI